jgi:hypothetical protein
MTVFKGQYACPISHCQTLTLVDLSEFVECGAKTGQITQLVHELRVHRSVGAK